MADVVHVIDDDDALRDALSFLLEVNQIDARFYPSAEAFLAQAAEATDGCILTDVRMAGLSGLDLVVELRRRGSTTPIVVMTGHGDVPMAVEALKAGVIDFIEKPFQDARLLEAVRAGFAARRDGSLSGGDRQAALRRLDSLSPRERDVLTGVLDGKLNKLIAFDLGISARTVEIYRANLMSKTGAGNLAELMRLALTAGL